MITLARPGMFSAALFLSVSIVAQDAEPEYVNLNWTLEEYQTRCIPIWSEEELELAVVDGGCTVGKFGDIAELDGSRFYYALYNDDKKSLPRVDPPDDIEAEIRRLRDENWRTESTALAIFKATAEDRERATVVHLRKQGRIPYGSLQIEPFTEPELIQTDIGPVIYLRGFGCCDGMQMYRFDEYWLWRDGDLLQVDTNAWFRSARERLRLPAGYSLNGISNLAQALPTLTYDASIWGPEDPDCCPSGGEVRIHFEWEDLTLRISSFNLALN